MMSDVTVTTTEDAVILDTPYHPALPAQARRLGGRFNWDDKTWRFRLRDRAAVTELATRMFGYHPDPSGETCAVRITLRVWDGGESVLRFAGRQIVQRRERDWKVWLADGVTVVEGEFEKKGGSRRNPELGHVDGVVLEIRDLPVELLNAEIELSYEVVTDPQ